MPVNSAVGPMKTYLRPFIVSEKKRLKQEVTCTPGLIIFGLMCSGLVLKLFHFLVTKLAQSHPFFTPFWWWFLPWLVLMITLVVRIEKGRKGRGQTKADLLAGNAFCHLVQTEEAIEIKQQEDEGPGYFIKTKEGEVLFIRGQFLERYVSRMRFPWMSFEMVETPNSRFFLGLRKLGETLKPSFVREPLSYDEARSFGFKNFSVLPLNFESLKVKPAGGPIVTAT
jgi:hypothetical protein